MGRTRARQQPRQATVESELVSSAFSGQSQPLPSQVRTALEPRFRHNFANVRIFDDAQAAQATSELNAKAFAYGENIAFSAGRYAPHDPVGQRLLTHELVHTMQQGPVSGAFPERLNISQIGDASEHQARTMSAAPHPFAAPSSALSPSAPTLQLEGEEEESAPIASPASVEPGVSYPGDTDIEPSVAAAPELNYTPGPAVEPEPTMERRDTPYGSFDVYSDDYPMSLAPAGPKAPAQRVTESQLENIDSNLMNIDAGGGGMAIQTREGDDGFRNQAKRDLAYLMTSQAGMGLVEDIPRTGRNLNIMHTNPGDPEPAYQTQGEIAGNEKAGEARTDGRPGAGTDVAVIHDPERTRSYNDPNITAPWVERDPAIGLGHELIHGLYDMRGTTAPGETEGLINPRGEEVSIPNSELQAVGRPFSGPGDTEYSENLLRAQLGELRREK